MVVKHVVDQGETPKTITTTVALRCDLRHTARAVNLSTATVGPVSSHFREDHMYAKISGRDEPSMLLFTGKENHRGAESNLFKAEKISKNRS